MGLLFTHPGLAREIGAVFDEETSARSAYRVSLEGGELKWSGEVNGTMETFDHEPEAGPMRVLFATIVGFLPIESQL